MSAQSEPGKLGIMQGRLCPPEGGRIQSFPAKTWREEFPRAKECGLDRIEWIVDDPEWERNPLMSAEGRAEIARLTKETGVEVKSACADLFMPQPLHSAPAEELSRREDNLRRIIEAAGEAGLEHIDVPFVDASAIKTDAALAQVAGVFKRLAPLAQSKGLLLCLETSLEPARFRALLERIGHPSVKANHDIGNSASLGYAPKDEFAALGEYVACVHIKDRVMGGGTVPLGTGNADFEAALAELSRVNYRGHFVLQVARGPDEIEWTKKNVAWARRFIARVGEAHGSRA